MTNEEFGLQVGCSESMASRLRSGARRPGVDLRERIMKTFEFDKDLETLKAFNEAASDAELFGAFLRERVFLDVVAA
jgi:transcriptional regulator with XRE-family HTH domain